MLIIKMEVRVVSLWWVDKNRPLLYLCRPKQSLSKGWNLGYGISYRFAKDLDFQTYDKVTGNIQTQNTYSNLREQTTNFYVSLSKTIQQVHLYPFLLRENIILLEIIINGQFIHKHR